MLAMMAAATRTASDAPLHMQDEPAPKAGSGSNHHSCSHHDQQQHDGERRRHRRRLRHDSTPTTAQLGAIAQAVQGPGAGAGGAGAGSSKGFGRRNSVDSEGFLRSRVSFTGVDARSGAAPGFKDTARAAAAAAAGVQSRPLSSLDYVLSVGDVSRDSVSTTGAAPASPQPSAAAAAAASGAGSAGVSRAATPAGGLPRSGSLTLSADMSVTVTSGEDCGDTLALAGHPAAAAAVAAVVECGCGAPADLVPSPGPDAQSTLLTASSGGTALTTATSTGEPVVPPATAPVLPPWGLQDARPAGGGLVWRLPLVVWAPDEALRVPLPELQVGAGALIHQLQQGGDSMKPRLSSLCKRMSWPLAPAAANGPMCASGLAGLEVAC